MARYLLVKKFLKVWKADLFFCSANLYSKHIVWHFTTRATRIRDSKFRSTCFFISFFREVFLASQTDCFSGEPILIILLVGKVFHFLYCGCFGVSLCLNLRKAFGSSSGNFFWNLHYRCTFLNPLSNSSICNVFQEWYEIHTHTPCFLSIQDHIIFTLLSYSKSLGQFFLFGELFHSFSFSLHWFRRRAVLVALVWPAPWIFSAWVGRPVGNTGGNPKGPEGLEGLMVSIDFFWCFFLFIFFHHWDLWPCCMGFLVSLFRWNCHVEQLKLAGTWRSLRI